MPREIFPDKEPGDNLSAEHINKLNRVGRTVSGMPPGSFQFGKEGVSAGAPPFILHPVVVTGVPYGDEAVSCNEDEDLYRVRPRYWTGSEWAENDDVLEFCLDADYWDAVYGLEEIITAWWNPQREAFIPLYPPIMLGQLTAAAGNSSQFVRIYTGAQNNEEDTGILKRAFVRMAAVDGDKWVHIARIGRDWEVIAAEC